MKTNKKKKSGLVTFPGVAAIKRPFKYEVDITWSEEDSAYVVRVPELPGCVTHGESMEEAVKMADEAIYAYLEALLQTGQSIPVPLAEEELSGEFVVRTGMPALHRKLKLMAKAEGKSFNAFLVSRLKELKH